MPVNTNLTNVVGDYVPIGGGTVTGNLTVNGILTSILGSASILASGATNTNTLTLKANDTTFITFTTGATDVCELDLCTLDSSIAKGTWTASGTWTIPAVTLGGQVSANGQIISNTGVLGVGTSDLESWWSGYDVIEFGRSAIVAAVETIQLAYNAYAEADSAWKFKTANSANLWQIYSDGSNNWYYTAAGVINAAISWTTTMSLSSAGVLNVIGAYQVDGTQVVGNRVIDSRCDDTANSGDATTDGLIDSLRDAMITHGLIAAA